MLQPDWPKVLDPDWPEMLDPEKNNIEDPLSQMTFVFLCFNWIFSVQYTLRLLGSDCCSY